MQHVAHRTSDEVAQLQRRVRELEAVARRPVVFEVEDDEGLLRLSFYGVEICSYRGGTPQAQALLRFAAEQRAALAGKEEG